jgi:hypothetical protein
MATPKSSPLRFPALLGLVPGAKRAARGLGAAGASPATALSERCAWIRAFSAMGSLARRSLLPVVVTMISPACLVTSTPEFEDPPKTRPMLLASGASPDLREIVIIDQPAIEFRASVLSEDADDSVKVSLLIDYGIKSDVDERPYRDAEDRNKEVPPGALADGPRDVVAKLFPDVIFWGVPQAGCHTVTMMVSHNFDSASGCPNTLEDSSQLTWQVIRCDETPCEPDFADFDPRQDCPKATASCPASAIGGAL